MKRLILILMTMLGSALSMQAQELRALLLELDKCVEKKESYRAERNERIDSLRQQMETVQGAQLLEVYEGMYQAYSHFQTDSALFYLDKMNELPEVQEDPQKHTWVALNMAEQLAIMGAYSDAEDRVRKLHTTNMNREERTRYYHVCRTIYGWMADYMSSTPSLSKELRHKIDLYRDSIINTDTDPLSRDIVRADHLLANGKGEEAKRLIEKHLPHAEKEQKSYLHYILAGIYRQQKNTKEEMRQLALVAIEDLHRGVTEYAALPLLATKLKEQGEVERAYNYLFCSMEDANFCNAKLRSMEISEVFPIIEKSYKQKERLARQTERGLLLGVSVMTIMLVLAVLYLRSQMHKLTLTRHQLSIANDQLEEANRLLGMRNDTLQESNTMLQQMDRVKEEYIALFLDRCRTYLSALEKYRKSLLKLAKSNQNAELMKKLKDDTLIEHEQQKLYNDFDEAFLDLHPRFVEKFNALLRPEERLTPKRHERLNTELRIFALIRLGVTDTAQIAEFLDYSMPTIYNYRSRIRSKSIYSKEEFDQKLMEL
ncbi:MAG: hypothetical protein J5616_00260 [Bacteroidaceae bacterium]|nr:hypothetical protein [Bacteroidaceae bacterium]